MGSLPWSSTEQRWPAPRRISPRGAGRWPWTPSGRPASATRSAPTWCSCDGREPAPRSSTRFRWVATCPRSLRPSPGRSGCCTPPTRTCPACPRSGWRRAGCSTPSWPDGWPGSPGSGSGRSSSSCSGCGWRRGTGPRTGRAGRCPRTGWSTPRWTSRCSSQLRDVLAELLTEQGKLAWALEEFEAVRTAGPPTPRAEPWRRTSGIHKIRKPRALAIVRALWTARDRLAAERDIAPGPGAAGLDDRGGGDRTARLRRGAGRDAGVPRARPAQAGQLLVRGRGPGRWPWTPTQLPLSSPPAEGPPPVARWADRDPAAAARLDRGPGRDRRGGAAVVDHRWRTCCSPTCCGGCAGRRRTTATWPARCARAPPASGRSRCWRPCWKPRSPGPPAG